MRIRFLLSAFLLGAVLLFSACKSEPSVQPPVSVSTPDSESKVTEPLLNEGGTPALESTSDTEADFRNLYLSGEGAPSYVIIRGDNAKDEEIRAAVFLQEYLTKCGLDMSICTDREKNPVSDHEIVVGDTRRTDTYVELDARSLGEEGFFATAVGGRIFLKGGSTASTQDAVEHFLTEFFGYAGDPETASPGGTVTVPGDYFYQKKQSFPITGVTVAGRPLGDFRIAWTENLGNISGQAMASAIRDMLYKTTGIYLGNASEDWTGPVLLLSGDAAGGDFTVTAEPDRLILATPVPWGMELGWNRFFNDTFRDAEGEIVLKQGTVFESRLLVLYSEFGAVGDGKTDDFDAIIAAHDFANKNRLPVKADWGKTFRIGPGDRTAVIETNTDWTGANIIIDDREVTYYTGGKRDVFCVKSTLPSCNLILDLPVAFSRDTKKFDIALETDCLVTLKESETLRYIREGANANNGDATQEVIILRRDGTVDADNALLWDYTALSSAIAYPIDEETLTITGGTLITRAALTQDHSRYFHRGIQITRSNVVLTGMTHLVEGEETESRTPYWGFITTNDCADITVENCVFTGRRKTTMGTYEITPTRTANLTFRNCTQTNDINDSSFWGVMGSNYCKNITLDRCEFSRFDAHAGVRNVTIKNSTLGHQCLNAIGFGTLYIENSTLCGSSFINLRSDYGSTWDGDIIIKNCIWRPKNGAKINGYVNLIDGRYNGFHNFGYTCTMPKTITIDGLKIADATCSSSFKGVNILGNIVSAWTNEAFEEKLNREGYPYSVPERVTVSGYESEQGKACRLSANSYMYRNTEFVVQ